MQQCGMPVVRYFVADLDRSLAFYVGQLGFREVERWGPAFAQVERDGLSLWLSGPTTSAARPMPDGRTPEPGGWNRFVIEVPDLESLHSDLQNAGIVFRNEVISGPGGKQVLAEDPDGNPIELFEGRS